MAVKLVREWVRCSYIPAGRPSTMDILKTPTSIAVYTMSLQNGRWTKMQRKDSHVHSRARSKPLLPPKKQNFLSDCISYLAPITRFGLASLVLAQAQYVPLVCSWFSHCMHIIMILTRHTENEAHDAAFAGALRQSGLSASDQAIDPICSGNILKYLLN